MKTWNDCPICGNELGYYGGAFRCSKHYVYYEKLSSEWFYIGRFGINRFKYDAQKATIIYPGPYLENCLVPLFKIDTEEKINKLLLLA